VHGKHATAVEPQYLSMSAKPGTYKATSHMGEPGSLPGVSAMLGGFAQGLTLLGFKVQSEGAMHECRRLYGFSREGTEHKARFMRTARAIEGHLELVSCVFSQNGIMSHHSQPLRHVAASTSLPRTPHEAWNRLDRQKMRSAHMICKGVSVRITSRLKCSERHTCAVMPQRMQVIACCVTL
jgi:hypothetical protein